MEELSQTELIGVVALIRDKEEYQKSIYEKNLFRELQNKNAISFIYDNNKNSSIIFNNDDQTANILRKKLKLDNVYISRRKRRASVLSKGLEIHKNLENS